ncbi:MAG: hypothetical protein INF89_08890 [Roseomonas sp.]|nr:hypothetical protein [Roseomonas sp.]
MRSIKTQQTSFTAGELTPALNARTEVARYYSGAALIRNMLVRPQGGIRRRPGMRHLYSLAGGTDGVRVLPFAFNVDQTYCIALRSGAFDVFRADGTYLATVTSCPWNAAQAAQINRAQSADTMLLFHPDMQPQQIQRGATETTWTRTAISFSNIPTYDFGVGAEPVISASRGWPECGTFHDGRLWLGGLKSRPATMLASRIGDFFNLNVGTGLDDEAINITIDTDQLNAIHQMVSGRGLLIFTSGAEHTIEGVPITPKTVERRGQTRRGIKRYTTIAEVDGATLFIQRGGAALRQFLYSDTEAAWQSSLASLLAPHLIKNPIEITARTSASNDDADHVLLVNTDGTMTVMTTLRSQEVVAFTRWETQGQIKSACALLSGQVFFAVLRNGAIRIEQWDEACLTDGAVRQTTGGPFSSVSGLTHLGGLISQIIADNAYLGTAVPSDGAVTLPRNANAAEIGLGFETRTKTLPVEPRDQSGPLTGRRARITEITARVKDSGIFEIRGQPVILRQVGAAPAAPLDTPPPIFSGDIKLRGLLGHRRQQDIELSQTIPAPLELLALAYTVKVDE